MIKVPFYPNDETEMHCFQASMQMILGYFMPEREFTIDELVKISGSVPGMSTWPSRMLIELDKMGFDVVMIEGFDGHNFIARGADYLRDAFGGATAEWQIANGDIPKEQRDYVELFETKADIQTRIPTMDDVKRYIDDGYLVACNINSRKLKGLGGYVGHRVVILGVGGSDIELHNPGPPPLPNQKVSHADFEAAWASPNDDAKEMIAIRRRDK